jgi:hypothetical protein
LEKIFQWAVFQWLPHNHALEFSWHPQKIACDSTQLVDDGVSPLAETSEIKSWTLTVSVRETGKMGKLTKIEGWC